MNTENENGLFVQDQAKLEKEVWGYLTDEERQQRENKRFLESFNNNGGLN